jgi:hypothetical protein
VKGLEKLRISEVQPFLEINLKPKKYRLGKKTKNPSQFVLAGFFLWSWWDSNPRPDKETPYRLHA